MRPSRKISTCWWIAFCRRSGAPAPEGEASASETARGQARVSDFHRELPGSRAASDGEVERLAFRRLLGQDGDVAARQVLLRAPGMPFLACGAEQIGVGSGVRSGPASP